MKPEKLTFKLAVRYKCHECTNSYLDGKEDCRVTACPLYSYMPYRRLKPDLSFLDYNPASKGKVEWSETTREIPPEQIAAMQAGRKKGKRK